MILLWLIPGLFLPTVTGWLITQILEGRTPVLFQYERWVLGFVLGLTFTMFMTFLLHVTTGLPLSRMGYLLVQLLLVAITGILWLRLKPHTDTALPTPHALHPTPRWARTAIILLIIWTIVKLLSTQATFLLLTPPYHDDAVDNWNFRGKVFFVEQRIQLELPDEEGNLVPRKG